MNKNSEAKQKHMDTNNPKVFVKKRNTTAPIAEIIDGVVLTSIFIRFTRTL